MFALIPALLSWLVCQLFKCFRGRAFTDSGGFPSSHAGFTSALSTALFFQEGFSGVFALSLGLFLVVVHDALLLNKRHSLLDVVVGVIIGVVTAFALI